MGTALKGAARVCVRAGTYAQFSRGVPGEGHERRRPRVYWRVGVRSMPGGRGGLGRLDFALAPEAPDMKKSHSIHDNHVGGEATLFIR